MRHLTLLYILWSESFGWDAVPSEYTTIMTVDSPIISVEDQPVELELTMIQWQSELITNAAQLPLHKN